ncbi:MAG: type IV pilus assembly protein PilM [Planctomycetes bacterium]|nr:type IV pilus assembly protein PilM [Planctomycetota bacterium]
MAISSWGIDVSHSSIKAVKLQLGAEGVELAGLDVIEYPLLPDIQDADQVAAQIRTAMAEFRSRNKPAGSTVACSLPSRSSFTRLIKINPDVKPEDLESNIRVQAEGNIPLPLNEVIWGYQFFDREYKPDEEREYILFAIKNDIVNQFLEHVNVAKLRVDVLQFAPIALYNFVIYQFADTNSIVLDLGSSNTDLIIIENQKNDKRVWLRNLPVAGNDFTKELQGKIHLNFAEAEKLKLTSQPEKMKEVYKLLMPLMKTLSVEINRSIGWYKSVHKTAQFESIVLTGSSSQVHGFANFMHQSLQLKPLKLEAIEHIAVTEKVDSAMLKKYMPSLGVALGLALQGLGISENKVNLMPQEIINHRKIMKKVPFVAAAAALLGLTVYASYSNVSENLAGLDINRADKDSIQQKIGRNRESLKEVINKIQPVLQELNTLSKIGEHRDLPLKTLNSVNAVVAEISDESVLDKIASAGITLKDDAQKAKITQALRKHFDKVASESRNFSKSADKSPEAFAAFNNTLNGLEKAADDEIAALLDATQKDAYSRWKSTGRLWALLGNLTPVWVLDVRAYSSSGQANQPDVFRLTVTCAIEARSKGTDTLDSLKKIFTTRLAGRIEEACGMKLAHEPDIKDLGLANYLKGLEPLEPEDAGAEKTRYNKYDVIYEIPMNGNGGI